MEISTVMSLLMEFMCFTIRCLNTAHNESVRFWRTGNYKPEFHSPEEITVLEKHSCPELFLCQRGRMGLLIQSSSGEEVIELNPGQAILVEDYHNGFIIDRGGFFFVVERTDFTTEFINRETGEAVQ